MSPASAASNAEISAKKKPSHTLTVPFDDATWEQLDTLTLETALPKSGVIRRAVRTLAWMLSKREEGYKVALLKEGESPLLIELV